MRRSINQSQHLLNAESFPGCRWEGRRRRVKGNIKLSSPQVAQLLVGKIWNKKAIVIVLWQSKTLFKPPPWPIHPVRPTLPPIHPVSLMKLDDERRMPRLSLNVTLLSPVYKAWGDQSAVNATQPLPVVFLFLTMRILNLSETLEIFSLTCLLEKRGLLISFWKEMYLTLLLPLSCFFFEYKVTGGV